MPAWTADHLPALLAGHERLLLIVERATDPRDVALAMQAVRLVEETIRRVEGVAPPPVPSLLHAVCAGTC